MYVYIHIYVYYSFSVKPSPHSASRDLVECTAVDRMVKLGYQVNNCSDLVTWITNSLGSEIVLILITLGTVLALYWLYSLLRCVDDGCRKSSRILKSMSRSIYLRARSRFFPPTIRRRSTRARSFPGSSSNSVSRCFDRPNCPISCPTPQSLLHNTTTIPPQDSETISPNKHNDLAYSRLTPRPKTTTPNTPLSPLPVIPRRNPNRRRNSLL